MRLIDADKLEKDTEWDERVDGFTSYSSAEISNAETVYAIPIEWIKSKKIEYEHDRYDYVRGCFDGFNDCIDYLINEWEKENETD